MLRSSSAGGRFFRYRREKFSIFSSPLSGQLSRSLSFPSHSASCGNSSFRQFHKNRIYGSINLRACNCSFVGIFEKPLDRHGVVLKIRCLSNRPVECLTHAERSWQSKANFARRGVFFSPHENQRSRENEQMWENFQPNSEPTVSNNWAVVICYKINQTSKKEKILTLIILIDELKIAALESSLVAISSNSRSTVNRFAEMIVNRRFGNRLDSF